MDETPSNPAPRREPIFNVPPVVLGLAVLLVALYAVFAWAGPAGPGPDPPGIRLRRRGD